MVWFICDSCGDSIKKPKVQQHIFQCAAAGLTCIDCSRSFDQHSYQAHTTCVTESQKYAEGATKPGGFAVKGFFEAPGGSGAAAPAPSGNPGEDEFLAKRPPWKCSICNVSCTSLETLQGHASGKKHVRRAQAARNAAQNSGSGAAQQNGQAASAANGAQPPAADGNGAAKAADANAEAAPVANGSALAAVEAKGTQKHKWKKLAAEALRANGGVMKLKKLQSTVLTSAQCASDGSKAALKSDMLAKWTSSSQFQVGEDEVQLKA